MTTPTDTAAPTEAVDSLAWYLYMEAMAADPYEEANQWQQLLLRRWNDDGEASVRRQAAYRVRAERYLRVASGVGDGDGDRPATRCAAHHPDGRLIAVCHLAPGHRGGNHRDHSGRTWPKADLERGDD